MRILSFKNSIGASLIAGLLLTLASSVQAQAPATASVQGKTELLWFGQAGFRIKSPTGKMILIDPWITGGPKTPPMYKNDLAAIGPIDLLLVTHAHVDHLGDAPAVAKQTISNSTVQQIWILR